MHEKLECLSPEWKHLSAMPLIKFLVRGSEPSLLKGSLNIRLKSN